MMEEWDHEARIVPELVLLTPCFISFVTRVISAVKPISSID